MLSNITGIGPKTNNLLNKINIFSIYDLITYYPYRYQIYQIVDLNDAIDGEQVVVQGVIEVEPKVSFIRRNFNVLKFRMLINNLLVNIIIYNRSFIKPQLVINKKITVIGKYFKQKNEIIASNIKFEVIDEFKIESIYHLISGLNRTNLHKIISNAFNYFNDFPDYIPVYLNDKYQLIDKKEALAFIHNPKSLYEIKMAKLKLIYEELFIFMFKINYLKMRRKQVISKLNRNVDQIKIQQFIDKLPFKLTADQEVATKEIINDLLSNNLMNRLLLGDVGSGKTVVILNAIYANYLSGYQSALMAPTEILANQHYNSIKSLIKDTKINLALLTGSLSKKEKQNIIDDLQSGAIDLVIGTHAILEENVKFKNIGLVVTDEQHRFGVKQRENLRNKGKMCDILYMSATPIPRTYALTLFGDMDITMIKNKPKNRKEIITKIYKEEELKEVLAKMLEEIKKGYQIFVVAPLIENDEESDLTNVMALKSKLDVAYNNKIPIDIIHGRLKGKEKEEIMTRFKNNETKILISTTVIEVGIDIENATMMVIFDAHQFGLATLHQLRGRVGRNDFQSYCYLITNKDSNRLKVLEESNDGFYVSQKDLELRGSGDLFGTIQSGDMVFKLANIKENYKVLLQAQIDSEEFIKNNGYLSNHLYQDIISNISVND